MTDVFPPQPPPPVEGAPAPEAKGGEAPKDASANGDLPKRFGKYTLLRKLAQGGMAELFLALQKSMAGFEKLIVIKRILPSMNQDQAFIEMLLHEARIAATLSHPNIVQIFDVGQCDGLYYIAMEHIHGEDIRSIVRQMKKKGVSEFPLEHALQIILGMCAGLAYAHDKRDLDGSPLNIVHRDISPQNVVCTFSGDVKIVDFGIAKSDNKGVGETKSGKLKGKVPYMSPEQARGEEIDARSDIFATGVMLFELTTGKRLFKGQSEFETLKLICERDYPLPSQVRPGYPVELEKIVMKALAKDRNERYQSARDMQADLENFVRNERIAVSTIALQQFMQTLFEDMLAAQKEALLQGKQLADIIASRESLSGVDASMTNTGSSVISTASATRTISGVDIQRSSPVAWIVAAALGVALVGGGIGGYVYYKKHKQTVVVTGGNLPPTPKGSIEIMSDPSGAAIWIDGDLTDKSTPATIDALPLNKPINVKLTMDGFESEKKTITLSDKEMKGTVSVKLAKGSVTLDVAVKPESAKPVIWLDGKKQEGLAVRNIASGDQHKLEVKADGFQTFTTTFIGMPHEPKHFDVTLVPAPHVTPGVGTGKPNATVAAPAGRGKLNVDAKGGWCNISVDGAPKGPTPIAGLELSSGPHTVTCTPEGGKAQTTTINIPVDGVARHKFTL
jgi:serine/threonine-protein kinase